MQSKRLYWQNQYSRIADDWINQTFIVEGQAYLTLNRNKIRNILENYEYDVFEEDYLSGSIIKIKSIKQEKYSKVKILLDCSKGLDLEKLYTLTS